MAAKDESISSWRRLVVFFQLGKFKIVELWLGFFVGTSLLGPRAIADGRSVDVYKRQHHPHHLGTPLAAGIFVLGVLAVLVNYLADEQRQRVRATAGKTTVWGKPPKLMICLLYTSRCV